MSGKSYRKVEMLDMILGYACNSSCVFCTADGALRNVSMSTAEAIERLEVAVTRHRPSKVRFGGGEPLIRKDLPALVKFCRALGVRRVTVQTNGYMLSYPDYARRLKENGLDAVNISLRSLNASTYRRLTRVSRGRALAAKAVENVLSLGLPIELDVLIVKPVLPELEDITSRYIGLGVKGINFWYVSIEGRALTNRDKLVPTMTEAAAALTRVFDRFPHAPLRSFYIPYCFFSRHAGRVWHPVSENTLVVTPGDSFMLEAGRIDIGVKPPRCKGCAFLGSCFGARQNYIEHFGDGEIAALSPPST